MYKQRFSIHAYEQTLKIVLFLVDCLLANQTVLRGMMIGLIRRHHTFLVDCPLTDQNCPLRNARGGGGGGGYYTELHHTQKKAKV